MELAEAEKKKNVYFVFWKAMHSESECRKNQKSCKGLDFLLCIFF